MYGFILMILMSRMLCFGQNRRRFGFDGPFVFTLQGNDQGLAPVSRPEGYRELTDGV
jgi:hypothetical protein